MKTPFGHFTKSIILFCCLLASIPARSQIIYVCTALADLISVDLSTCTSTLIGNTGSPQADIALTPNGTLYGIDMNGLVSINTSTAATTLVAGAPPFPTAVEVALVSDANGVLYSASNNLYRLDPVSNSWVLVGSLNPYVAGGDLTFYNGDLYMADVSQQLVRITLNPFGLQLIGNMQTATDPIFGIITSGQPIVDTCTGLVTGTDSVRMFATGGRTIFEVDPQTAAVTPFCVVSAMQQIDGLFGAASPQESQSVTGGNVNPVPQLAMPNVFTPNGDLVNDLFRLPTGTISPNCADRIEYSLRVFNRWGNELYSGRADTGWDGNFNNSPSPDGVYYWILTATTASATTNIAGFVTLNR
ncbi:MAG: gliding motility-associated C-terminal domain-containing protein [Bacteroidia bacterium]|jgi:gliding motility-associated-like protein|nr:gliding motility-associated C-terminal domain-containing protein [Bacteroidia bacterium]